MNSAAERLRFARKARGLSQVALASLASDPAPDKKPTTGGCIAQIECGIRGGGRDLWRRLAAALGTSTDWLLDGVGRAPIVGSDAHPAPPRQRAAAKAS